MLVDKSNGQKRLCVDFIKLNCQTVSQPMADVDVQLGELSIGHIFCVLDFFTGYLKIPLSAEAKEKTAFVTQMKKLCLNVCRLAFETHLQNFVKL